ncbi:MAG: SMP-30/gluconolactonase/LRE family protein [Pseudomonadota bacterium]
MTAYVFDNRRCELGEGALWHPELKQLFWFDILNKMLMTRQGDVTRRWQFDECVSAAGWVDADTLIVASEVALSRFSLSTSREDVLVPLEADRPETRSNDGRADRQGGFWIGTMGKAAEPGMGTIYRYYRGELRVVVEGITIPNGICFSEDGTRAFYACSPSRKIFSVSLDSDGWPKGEAQVFVDLTRDDLIPDGAVIDAAGLLWSAHWGASKVSGYDAEGARVADFAIPAKHCTCPAFGGPNLTTLYCTSALEALDPEEAARSENGMTFAVETEHRGLPEPRVVL